LLSLAQDDGAGLLQQKHSAVDELAATLKRNSDVGTLVGLAAQATARGVLIADHKNLDAIVVLEVMQPVGERRVAGRAQYPGDGDHVFDSGLT